MTWAKYGTEFFDQLVDDFDFPLDLDDACQLTHVQAIHYLYSVESMTLRFKKASLGRFATSSRASEAAQALATAGAWADRGREWEVLHHADVVRQSLAAQLVKRDTEKKRQQDKRAKARAALGLAEDTPTPTPDVGANVGTDVGTNVRPTQTDSHTDNQKHLLSDENSTNHDEVQPRFDSSPSTNSDEFPPGDPWHGQPSTYPLCGADGCKTRLTTDRLKAQGFCFNHKHSNVGAA